MREKLKSVYLNQKVAGMELEWPEVRGIFHQRDKTFFIWVTGISYAMLGAVAVIGILMV